MKGYLIDPQNLQFPPLSIRQARTAGSIFGARGKDIVVDPTPPFRCQIKAKKKRQ